MVTAPSRPSAKPLLPLVLGGELALHFPHNLQSLLGFLEYFLGLG